MRVLLVLPYLNDNGTERHALLLARHLLAGGHRVALAAPPGPMEAPFRAGGVDVNVLPAISPVSFGRAMRETAALARESDVTHVHAAQEFCGGLRWAGYRGPLVFTAHCYHDDIDYWKAGWFLNPFCQRVVAVSGAERRRLEKSGVRRLATVLNGIDAGPLAAPDRESSRAALGLAAGTVLAIAVGRLARPKGLATFVKAIAATRGDVSGLVVGDGPDRGALERLARRCKLGDRVRFLGRRDDIPQLLAAADVYVSASHREGLSLAALEALACGLPLVVTDIPEFAEVARPGHNAIVFKPGDAGALARALSALAASADRRRDLAEASSQLAGEFTLRQMGEGTLAVYREALAK